MYLFVYVANASTDNNICLDELMLLKPASKAYLEVGEQLHLNFRYQGLVPVS